MFQDTTFDTEGSAADFSGGVSTTFGGDDPQRLVIEISRHHPSPFKM